MTVLSKSWFPVFERIPLDTFVPKNNDSSRVLLKGEQAVHVPVRMVASIITRSAYLFNKRWIIKFIIVTRTYSENAFLLNLRWTPTVKWLVSVCGLKYRQWEWSKCHFDRA